jgi:5-methylcytosine-specific restriction endonuclease McrA
MLYPCKVCGIISPTKLCPAHGNISKRLSYRQRGYTKDFQAQRLKLLADSPSCSLCDQPATVADHHPIERAQLLLMEVKDPDDLEWLRPLCTKCHNIKSARRAAYS